MISETIDSLVFTSRVDDEYTVVIAYQEYDRYNELRTYLENLNNSIGALQVGTKTIVIDGERVTDELIDNDHLLAIEAHEIAHDKLNHEAGYNEQSEFEADTLGATLLMTLGYDRAASLLGERIQQYVDNYYK